jgi:putative hydrolase of the HAD superfamily
MVKAVLFDLFETLITENGLDPTRAGRLAPRLALPEADYRSAWKAQRPRIARGEVSFADALASISSALGHAPDGDTIEAIRAERLRQKARAFEGARKDVVSVITRLRARGVRLAVVSNGFDEDVAGWPTWRAAGEFEIALFSCREGVAKPDAAIYRRALTSLGLQAEEAMYVGDGGDDELRGAQRAGLTAFQATWFLVREAQLAVPGVERLAAPQDVLHVVARE